mmetsp:Transcript_8762/g.13083  ORF Transcript_8762/g.13083 Transcript_8762/m.13083 type:complete len:352 (-) Transcript_8762:92-1147(-)|eukprot:CAMPEP_0203671212 /NCGR_PEP_ID=MMETSP0090-20130426/7051_1 /ASSEMBLY_ACC=CAM_ASM_001088 /TAXON_ID=426623 /ORGANISM="Chaetoceros affinis, Strain CCMP159" /LENGTH=351 /DNA_ID=CAMNT_0050536225 /DNA_START=11 /DNA_END=1066 /DNA_ORIENTATION=-
MKVTTIQIILFLTALTSSCTSYIFPSSLPQRAVPVSLFSATTSTSAVAQNFNTNKVGDRIPIDESFAGLKRIYSGPDIFIIEDFLDKSSCEDLIRKAQEKKLDQSPVAYAGKTDDKNELIGLAAKGPVAWIALGLGWFQVQQSTDGNIMQLGINVLENYVLFFILAFASITAFIEFRADELQTLRTSTSTTLDNLEDPKGGAARFVKRAADLFNPNSAEKINPAKHAQYFESPTVIRYEKDQVLAPHFDANKAASTEDANRGGQTLATLLLYLNDVENGGNTRFGLLDLTVKPKMGDALLFFPADADGLFDDRLEHEGCTAVDTKWIARIWRHIDRVQPPFGLSNRALSQL